MSVCGVSEGRVTGVWFKGDIDVCCNDGIASEAPCNANKGVTVRVRGAVDEANTAFGVIAAKSCDNSESSSHIDVVLDEVT